MANKLDICKATYSNWENGKAEITVGKLEALGKVLNKPISYFINTDSHYTQVNNGDYNYQNCNHNTQSPEIVTLLNQSLLALKLALEKLK